LANYSTGTVAVLPINPDGSLAPLSDLRHAAGQAGPAPDEQVSAHPHDVVLDPRGRFIVVPDKGLDTTFVFRLDNRHRQAGARRAALGGKPARRGPAPRDFHPSQPYLYQIHEPRLDDHDLQVGHAARRAGPAADDRRRCRPRTPA